MSRVRERLGMLAFVVLLLLASIAATHPPEWDPRLDEINVTLARAPDCSAGCWRLVAAQYEDESEAGGDHNIYARLLDEDGAELVGAPWRVAWPDGSATIHTKPAPEWSDFPLYGCYFPDQGAAGGYRAFAGSDEATSDAVHGMGLPYCHHVNFRLLWRWDPGGPPPPTPTATPSPCATCAPAVWLPMVIAGASD